MNLFKRPKYLLMILLASISLATFAPHFSHAFQSAGIVQGVGGATSGQIPNPQGSATKADEGPSWIAVQLGHVVYQFTIRFPSIILLQEIKLFRLVGTYNGFTTEPQVAKAWSTVRDLANMFFILILLLMSFGTILQISGYGYRQLLSRLLLMAILINFSKSIVAILIDFSQIITLTFLAPVFNNIGGNLEAALGLSNIMQLPSNPSGESYQGTSFLSAMILGGIMMIITTVIIGVILVMFLMRVVAFWIMVILSPMAYLAKAFPKTTQYYNQWEGELSSNLTLGPGLAFFIWLAFSIVGQGNINSSFSKDINNKLEVDGLGSLEEDTSLVTSVSKAATTANLLNFVVGISLLMAGLKFAAGSKAVGASFAGKASGNLQKWGSRIGRGATVGAALGAGALAWRGTSGEGGVKGGLSWTKSTAGKGMVKVGDNLNIGALQRGGLSMQASENLRLQRKQNKFNKRFEGMSDEDQKVYNESLAKGFGFLGKREAKANLAEEEIKTTKGAIDPARAKELQKDLKAAGKLDSVQKLEARSGALLTEDKLNRLVDKMGPAVLHNLNLEGASQDVLHAVANLSEDVLAKGFEGMSDDIRKKAMAAIDPIVNNLDGDMSRVDSAKYKARILQARYSAKNAGSNGLANDFDSANDQQKMDFLSKAKLSGKDISKFDSSIGAPQASKNMFDYIVGKATQAQTSEMISNLTNDINGQQKLQQITKARVRSGKLKEMKNVAGGIAEQYIEDSDIQHYITNDLRRQLPAGATVAQQRQQSAQIKNFANNNLSAAHLVYNPGTSRNNPGMYRTEFINFVEGLSVQQLKDVDRNALAVIKNSLTQEAQDRLMAAHQI